MNFVEPTSETNFKIHYIEISLTGTSKTNNNSLGDVITFAEVATLWNIDPSTLRHRIKNGKLEEGIDYKKSGKVIWC